MSRNYLSTEEVGDRYGVPPATVRKWRHMGTGPRGIRVGRHVRYSEDECERWEDERLEADTRGAA